MKRLFLVLIILLLSVAAALWFKEINGYALLSAGPWTVQMSLFVFIGGLIVFWVALNALWGLLQRLWHMPAGVRLWAGNRRRVKARKKLVGGLMLLAEGRNKEAEKAALHRADAFDMPVLSYLVAAIAAQRQGAWKARDEYLTLASYGGRRAQVALSVLQAQLRMQAKQWEPAMDQLSLVYEQAPHNRHALRLLAECASALQNWERLAQLLPDLRMNQVLPEAELEALEVQTAEARLGAASTQGSERLEAIWRGFTREQKRLPAIVALYARSLIRTGQAELAEQLLRTRLEKSWDSRLVNAYAELDLEPAERVFEVTERWLNDHPDDPDLLYAAGHQALRSEQLGSARAYLEASVSRRERPETLRLLGDVYDRLGEPGHARDSYRRALVNALKEEPVHRPVPAVAAEPTSQPPPVTAEPFVPTTASS